MCIVDLMTEQNHGGRTSSLPLSLALNFSLWEVVCIRSVVFPPLNAVPSTYPGILQRHRASLPEIRFSVPIRASTRLHVCQRHDRGTSQPPLSAELTRSSSWSTLVHQWFRRNVLRHGKLFESPRLFHFPSCG